MYKITLANGQYIQNLDRNGDCFLSKDPEFDAEVFTNNLDTVTIENLNPEEGEPSIEVINNGKLVKCDRHEGIVTFAIAEKTTSEIAAEKLMKAISQDNANIEDLQMAVVSLYELIIGA